MIEQQPKKRVDVGQIGNASTGDILYDGGVKVNSNFDSVYNAFADQRYYAAGFGVENMKIHATGYYQKVDQAEFRTPIALGSQYDVDASTGAVSPILPKGKRGEGCVFVNMNGTLSINNPMVIQASANGSFVGLSDSLTVTTPYSRVECWCISDSGNPIWNYSISSIFGEKQSAIEGTYSATKDGKSVQLAHISQYKTIKLLLTASSTDGTRVRSSEVNLLVDNLNKKIYDTEYAVQSFGADGLITFDFTIDVNNFINMNIKSPIDGVKLAVKSIATQRIGSA